MVAFVALFFSLAPRPMEHVLITRDTTTCLVKVPIWNRLFHHTHFPRYTHCSHADGTFHFGGWGVTAVGDSEKIRPSPSVSVYAFAFRLRSRRTGAIELQLTHRTPRALQYLSWNVHTPWTDARPRFRLNVSDRIRFIWKKKKKNPSHSNGTYSVSSSSRSCTLRVNKSV